MLGIQAAAHWSLVYTAKITDEVKLVGSTISCEGTWLGGDVNAEKRQNPHVQSFIMATDQVGHPGPVSTLLAVFSAVDSSMSNMMGVPRHENHIICFVAVLLHQECSCPAVFHNI